MRPWTLLSVVFYALGVAGIEQKPLFASERDTGLNIEAIEQDGFLIFNEVNALMRQWGNALAPNGFSVTLASVPANTLLYHARTDSNEPSFPEWRVTLFALDAEMSYGIFGGRKDTTVYLQTYRTTATLSHLLYFDGLSAAVMGGTIDAQDLLALSSNSSRPPGPFGDYARAKHLCSWASSRGVEGFVRTNAGFELIWCNKLDKRFKLVRNIDVVAWAGDMDDYSDTRGSDEGGETQCPPWELHGFSSPFCPPPPHLPEPGEPTQGPGSFVMFARYASWEWLRAASHTYNGLGETRVWFQSGWHVTPRGLTLDSVGANRLAQLSSNSIRVWKGEVDDMLRLAVQERRRNSGVDWRALTDLIVNRYADRLPELSALLKLALANTSTHTSTPGVNTTAHLQHAYRVASSIVLPFYDRAASKEEQVEICTLSILPDVTTEEGEADSLNRYERKIWTAVTHVHWSICTVIIDTYSELTTLRFSQASSGSRAALEAITARVDSLIVQLDWSVWVRCTDVCPWGQVCYIPIWPLFDFGSWPKLPAGGRPEPQCVGSLVDPV